ncbi:hypothetical protein [Amycolatopsis panacis]|uniref:Uncharacterized protein n=1 Tax=Amycolatopsis panacis TaxID=2340917 RepID=A0A419I855_9PSEU|nr:hypothetical protein [Amycolatopsis panacis]RJQ88246.1 hypothetical protein D5S19_08075 [Amycolatopsis panacis]
MALDFHNIPAKDGSWNYTETGALVRRAKDYQPAADAAGLQLIEKLEMAGLAHAARQAGAPNRARHRRDAYVHLDHRGGPQPCQAKLERSPRATPGSTGVARGRADQLQPDVAPQPSQA